MTDNILCDQFILVIGKNQKKVVHWFLQEVSYVAQQLTTNHHSTSQLNYNFSNFL